MLSTGKRNAARGSGARSGDGPDGNSGPGGTKWRSAAERYEVLGRAGEGTLFAVYRVRDRSNGRIHALKALKNAFVKHPRLTANLARMAEQALAFNHPYLGRTSDVGQAEGTLYVVSEWLQGQNLEDRLRQSPLPHTETLLFTRQIAEALNFLHGKGMAHGDLRSRQIFLTSGTHLKITDPGIGEALHQSGIAAFDVQPDTAYFLSPERFDGAPPSAAADYYALGVILYHMLTGRVPFDGPSPLVIAARHRNDVPLRPSQFNPNCSPQLEELAMCLLDKNPQTRLQSAQELFRQMGGGDAPVYQSPYVEVTRQQIAAAAAPAPVAATVPIAPARPAAPIVADEPVYAPPPNDERVAAPPVDVKVAKRRHRRREFWSAVLALFWFFVSIGLLGGMGYAAYHFWIEGIPPEVRVPKYVGLSRSVAEQVLQRVGLGLEVGSEKYVAKTTEDTVLSGDVPPGKAVRRGRIITVVISKGEEPIKMYDFSELSLKRAREIISRDGMRLGTITEQYHDRIPAGYVCGQYPEASAPFRRSEQINLSVSKGAPPPSGDIPEVEPLPPPPVPNVLPEDTQAPSTTEAPAIPMISRSVAVRVALPKTGTAQEVKIVVNDANGEETVYQEMHDPGDLVDETVRVRREQGTTARIRVYIGDKIFRDQRI